MKTAMKTQDVAAERDFYDELFTANPDNEHITTGYEELYEAALDGDGGGPSAVQDNLALDIGCGTGAHALRLARRGLRVVAVDLSVAGVQAARERLRSERLEGQFVVADAEQLPFRDSAAPLVWSSLLIHHFPDPSALLDELARVTGRRLVAFEPNAGNLLTWFAMNVVNRYVGLKAMTPNQVAVRPRRLIKRAGRRGFTPVRIRYVHRAWADRLGPVRRIYEMATAGLPERMRANKFLVVLEKRPE